MTSDSLAHVRYWIVTAIPSRVLLWIGAIAAATSFWTFSAQRTILDPAATRDLATDLIATSAVSGTLAEQLAEQLFDRLPTEVADSDVAEIARAAIESPRFARAFAGTIESLHDQLLDGDRSGDVAIDTRALNRALSAAAVDVSPELAERLRSAEPIELSIDSGRLPSLEPIDHGAATLMTGSAIVALIAFALGVMLHPDPWRAVSLVGRRLAAVAVMPLVLYLVVPAALRALGGWGEKSATFASAYGNRILPVAISVFVGGVGLWIGGQIGRRTALPTSSRRPRGSMPTGARGTRRRGEMTSHGPAGTRVGPGTTDLRL
jgi:VIT1/CCC1 family predicted Fe2+/Mn2+ transporter